MAQAKILEMIIGNVGTAFLIEAFPNGPDQEATLHAWHLKITNPLTPWDRYTVGLIHLRDIPGVKPAHKDYPEAEYEIIVLALDPDHNPTEENTEQWVALTPVNYRAQFDGISDKEAGLVAEHIAKELINGHIPIEPEGIRGAKELFRQSVKEVIKNIKARSSMN